MVINAGIKCSVSFYHYSMAFPITDITSIITIIKHQRLFSLFISLLKFEKQTFIIIFYATVAIMVLSKI